MRNFFKNLFKDSRSKEVILDSVVENNTVNNPKIDFVYTRVCPMLERNGFRINVYINNSLIHTKTIESTYGDKISEDTFKRWVDECREQALYNYKLAASVS